MLFVIDDILEEMVLENRSHFSPHFICSRANIDDLKSVTDHLFNQVGSKLKVYFEVECPEGDSDFSVRSPQELNPELEVACHICGTKYLPDPDRVWISFDFTPNYIEYVKKKKLNEKLYKKHKKLLILV